MVCCSGLTRPGLLLLCCLGTCLSAPMVTVSPMAKQFADEIFQELRRISARLLRDFKKDWKTPVNNREKMYPLPCLSPGSDLADNDTSIVLAHFKQMEKIQGSPLRAVDVQYTIEQLEKLRRRDGPEPQVPACAGDFECKRYILEILQQFSDCVTNTLEPSRKRL